MKWLLNSAVIAVGAYGEYRYSPTTPAEARAWLASGPIESRIGYMETADIVRRELGHHARQSRESSAMAPGDQALVVRLLRRVADPKSKGTRLDLRLDDFELAFLERLA